jgi:hypothetical protein
MNTSPLHGSCRWVREKGGFWWLVIIPLSVSWSNSPDISHVRNPACLIALVKTQGSKRNIAILSFFFGSYFFLPLVFYICSFLLSLYLLLLSVPCRLICCYSLFLYYFLIYFHSIASGKVLSAAWSTYGNKNTYSFGEYIVFKGSFWKI